MHRSKKVLFDHLVGNREQRRRDRDAQHLGGPEIDDQYISLFLLDGQIAGLGAPQGAINVSCCPPPLIEHVAAVAGGVADQATALGKVIAGADRRQVMAQCQVNKRRPARRR